MSIPILSREEIEGMRAAGRVARATLDAVAEHLPKFRTTADVADFVAEDTHRRGGRPSQLGYHGFPSVCCTSRNDVVCHGIPSRDEVLRRGDILNVDVTTEFGGFHGDTSRTFALGEISPELLRLVSTAERARDVGIDAIAPGKRLGEVGQAIETFVRSAGMSVVRELGGHGIGRRMHQDPHVAHHATPGGVRLRAGMAITIEPMVNLGGPEVVFLDDGWTVKTLDGSPSAQFEHTVLVTETGFEVLT